MSKPIVVEWDSAGFPPAVLALLPAELRGLAPGRYLIEPLLDDAELTREEEAGILEAIAEIDAGQAIPWEAALRDLRDNPAP